MTEYSLRNFAELGVAKNLMNPPTMTFCNENYTLAGHTIGLDVSLILSHTTPFNALKHDPEYLIYLAFFWDELGVEDAHEYDYGRKVRLNLNLQYGGGGSQFSKKNSE